MDQPEFERTLGAVAGGKAIAVGSDPRGSEAYSAMRTEIDRLTDIHASVPVDWREVARLGADILKHHGKDLSVATWLTVALFHTRELLGLAEGLHVLRDLVQGHWDTMSPPATRLRGRRNQIQWMLDQLSAGLQHAQAQFRPIPPRVHDELLADWDALETSWQQHDSDAPAFYGLKASLKNLPVDRPAADTHAPVNSHTSAGAVATEPDGARIAIESASVALPVSGGDPDTVAESALAGLRPIVDWYLQQFPTLPLLFRFNRICAWAALEQAPPSQNGATRLPPPPDQILVGFEKILQGGNPQAVIHFAESRLVSHRFWLDLNRASHSALSRLGAEDAAMTVAFETAQLISRLPQLPYMQFSDGHAFADADTMTWLASLERNAPGATGMPGAADPVAETIAAAESAAVNGKLNEALDSLQDAALHSGRARDKFRLRLAQCALLQRYDARADMRPLLAALMQELDIHRLVTWEPELAQQALELAATTELRYGAFSAATHESMLARLASVDVRSAWRLSQSTAPA